MVRTGAKDVSSMKILIGTPAYMSPEQADPACDIDTRSDVFSLGVVLYAAVWLLAPETDEP